MAKNCWAIVKRQSGGNRLIMQVFAVCTGTKEEAHAITDNANAWYGEDHPLTPLTVEMLPVLLDPRPFPVGKPIEHMFDDIDKD